MSDIDRSELAPGDETNASLEEQVRPEEEQHELQEESQAIAFEIHSGQDSVFVQAQEDVLESMELQSPVEASLGVHEPSNPESEDLNLVQPLENRVEQLSQPNIQAAKTNLDPHPASKLDNDSSREAVEADMKAAQEKLALNPLPVLPESADNQEAISDLPVGTVLNLFQNTSDSFSANATENVSGDAAGRDSVQKALSRWKRPPSVESDKTDALSVSAEANPGAKFSNTVSSVLDDSVDPSVLDGTHPLMSRVQAAITQNLRAKLAAVELDIRNGNEKVSFAVNHREEVGVTLYNLQQQLVKAQAQVEQSEESAATIRGYREEAERNLKHTLESFNEISAKKRDLENLTEQQKGELESVLQTLKQVNVYQEELLSKIQVARRTTLKAEEDLKRVEWEKQRQDYYVDKLEQQLRQQQEQRTLYEVQLKTQKAETAAATATLREASQEMEELAFEKRQLLQQWRSSVLGVERRVEQIRGVDNDQQKMRESINDLESELSSVRKSIRKITEEGERLHGVIRKVESETAFVERQIQGVQEERSQLQEQYQLCQTTLQDTESKLSSASMTKKNLQRQLTTLVKSVHGTANATKQLEMDLEEYVQEQQAVVKGNEMTVREYRKLRELCREKEAMIIQTENEVSRTRDETFRVETRLDALRSEHSSLEVELQAKLELIGRFEVSMKRQTEELAKKQNEVDFLNRKIEKMTANGGEAIENMGPLEATIKNTLKLIRTKVKESEELEAMWLRNQNEHVNLLKTIEDLKADISDCQLRMAVLLRKKGKVNSLYEDEEREIREHKRKIKNLEHQMRQLNTLIVKQRGNENQLQELTTGLEQQLRQRLKDAELEILRLDTQISETQAAKEQAVENLVEAERQVMLWDKKIQLAKETREALDPTVGANEIQEMTKEIHRMKLRYSSMLKLQEKMVMEMERAVQRRELLSIKNANKSKGAAQTQLVKVMADLNKKHRQTIAGIQMCNEDMVLLLNTQEHVQRQIEEAQAGCKELSEKERQLECDALSKAAERIALHIETVLFQKHGRRYEDLITEKQKSSAKDLGLKQQELEKQSLSIQQIQAIALKAINAFPIPSTSIPLTTVSNVLPSIDLVRYPLSS